MLASSTVSEVPQLSVANNGLIQGQSKDSTFQITKYKTGVANVKRVQNASRALFAVLLGSNHYHRIDHIEEIYSARVGSLDIGLVSRISINNHLYHPLIIGSLMRREVAFDVLAAVLRWCFIQHRGQYVSPE